jgi:hypothetical protein
MAGEGSAALGAPALAGAMVNPRGFGKTVSAGAVGGVVGAVAATAVASRSSKASDVPPFGRVGYIAASETEVALIKTNSGALKMKVTDQALARAPRDELEVVVLIGWPNHHDPMPKEVAATKSDSSPRPAVRRHRAITGVGPPTTVSGLCDMPWWDPRARRAYRLQVNFRSCGSGCCVLRGREPARPLQGLRRLRSD